MNQAERFPLEWPDGWPRTEPELRQWSLAGGRGHTVDWNTVLQRLDDNLRLLGAEHVVLSTNQPIRKDGQPYAARRRIEDPGAAVYFMKDGVTLVMAQDCYQLLTDNIRSLCLAIEGLRQVERHGGGVMLERAFQGFAALPPPPEDWWEVMGFSYGVPQDFGMVRDQYHREAKRVHPDKGGSTEQMAALNDAYQQAKEYFRV